jgi:hypothetical protein
LYTPAPNDIIPNTKIMILRSTLTTVGGGGEGGVIVVDIMFYLV